VSLIKNHGSVFLNAVLSTKQNKKNSIEFFKIKQKSIVFYPNKNKDR